MMSSSVLLHLDIMEMDLGSTGQKVNKGMSSALLMTKLINYLFRKFGSWQIDGTR